MEGTNCRMFPFLLLYILCNTDISWQISILYISYLILTLNFIEVGQIAKNSQLNLEKVLKCTSPHYIEYITEDKPHQFSNRCNKFIKILKLWEC